MSSIKKLPKTKIALLIVEGPSDATTFENSLRNYLSSFSNDSVRSPWTTSNRTLMDSNNRLIPPANIRKEIGKRVNKFLRDNSLRSSDLLLIGQICDLDACFAADTCFVCDALAAQVKYDLQKQQISYWDRDDLIDKRHKKRANIETLSTTPNFKIGECIIPYKLFYFGINLEHCLYDRPNCSDEEKQVLAESFDEEHAEKSNQFEQRLRALPFISEDYLKSWNETELEKQALKPLTNICILLDWVKEIEYQDRSRKG